MLNRFWGRRRPAMGAEAELEVEGVFETMRAAEPVRPRWPVLPLPAIDSAAVARALPILGVILIALALNWPTLKDYFHGDDFDPGGRGVESRAILSAHHLTYAVIDQPPHFTTHWAATTPKFVQAYGNCILGFLDDANGEPAADCKRDALWASAPNLSADRMVAAHEVSAQGSAQE